MPDSPPFDLAAVVLAGAATATDAPLVQAMIRAARAAGAEPVVVVVPRGMAAPEGARVAQVAAGAAVISGLRAGMALLANSTARFVLLWPFDDEWSDTDGVMPLVEGARREGAPVTAMEGADLDHEPIVVARDSWLELMTIGEQGMDALAARRGVHRVQN
jgi:CTP:molybdopterin cytidylyltransferase MocA